jgi:hypothetical protein
VYIEFYQDASPYPLLLARKATVVSYGYNGASYSVQLVGGPDYQILVAGLP